jgi:hypothetical protein
MDKFQIRSSVSFIIKRPFVSLSNLIQAFGSENHESPQDDFAIGLPNVKRLQDIAAELSWIQGAFMATVLTQQRYRTIVGSNPGIFGRFTRF